jgi:hypothetical protein
MWKWIHNFSRNPFGPLPEAVFMLIIASMELDPNNRFYLAGCAFLFFLAMIACCLSVAIVAAALISRVSP